MSTKIFVSFWMAWKNMCDWCEWRWTDSNDGKWERDESKLKKKRCRWNSNRDEKRVQQNMRINCSVHRNNSLCPNDFHIKDMGILCDWKRAPKTHEHNHAHANSRDTKGRFIASSSTHPNKWTRMHYCVIFVFIELIASNCTVILLVSFILFEWSECTFMKLHHLRQSTNDKTILRVKPFHSTRASRFMDVHKFLR